MLTVAVGGVLWRLARLSTAGVVLWCLTVVVLSAVTWVPRFGMEEGLILLGLVGSLASSVVFLVVAARTRSAGQELRGLQSGPVYPDRLGSCLR